VHDCPDCAAPGGPSLAPAGPSRRALLTGVLGGAAGAIAAARLRFPGARLLDSLPAAAVKDPAWPIPSFVTRAQWGADETMRKSGQEFSPSVQKIVVHHTVTPNNPPDPRATMRGIYQYHLSTGYIDIAYNWAIDHKGRIYQGRWSPNDRLHIGENSSIYGPLQVDGAHALYWNRRSIGVAMLGTFTDVMPTPAAIDSLVTVLTWKCARWGIDPMGASLYTPEVGTAVRKPNIAAHRDVRSTACPGSPLYQALPLIRGAVADRLSKRPPTRPSAYWILSLDGAVLAFGDVKAYGAPKSDGVIGQFAGIASRPGFDGYWVLGHKGGVFAYGSAPFLGSLTGFLPSGGAVDIAATPTGNGYWILVRDGTIAPFGDAKAFGSTKSMRLNAPVRRLVPTGTGRGYWVVAEDGGVFAFGDAPFFGSTGAMRLNQPVVSMAPTPSGRGYWLVAADGGVFSFGDARFYGSTGALRLAAPVIDIAATRSGSGYGLLAADGGVFAFGDMGFAGSAAGKMTRAVGFAGRFG
jgi:hypothetical protein